MVVLQKVTFYSHVNLDFAHLEKEESLSFLPMIRTLLTERLELVHSIVHEFFPTLYILIVAPLVVLIIV